jgi:hypothetical protein
LVKNAVLAVLSTDTIELTAVPREKGRKADASKVGPFGTTIPGNVDVHCAQAPAGPTRRTLKAEPANRRLARIPKNCRLLGSAEAPERRCIPHPI